jgi:hypothetical protein
VAKDDCTMHDRVTETRIWYVPNTSPMHYRFRWPAWFISHSVNVECNERTDNNYDLREVPISESLYGAQFSVQRVQTAKGILCASFGRNEWLGTGTI